MNRWLIIKLHQLVLLVIVLAFIGAYYYHYKQKQHRKTFIIWGEASDDRYDYNGFRVNPRLCDLQININRMRMKLARAAVDMAKQWDKMIAVATMQLHNNHTESDICLISIYP